MLFFLSPLLTLFGSRPGAQVICHGIPDERPLEDGDIVNLDISVFLDGYHGALAPTFAFLIQPVRRIPFCPLAEGVVAVSPPACS